ncbi:MAG: hypothetical protein EP326_12210 [Deltaproteobacteria bacterium]|nr:MAG: hypothetical protein EP326_12210 [Deltaproteobacteria bacterium]TNF26135.1 MAG: hypothetical protein EP319_14630 [Deltaproteobacteria bacterium]
MKKIILIATLLLSTSEGFTKVLVERSPANSSYRQQIINCNGDETCIGLVLLSAIQERDHQGGGGYYNRYQTRLYGTANCNEQYYFGSPGSKTCPSLIQAHGDANVWSYKQNGNCVSLSTKLSLSRACLIHGPSN